jgi:DNA invertase Pin-like site-specific DNA recombinase
MSRPRKDRNSVVDTAETPRAAGYIRVSTQKQAMSPAAQAEKIQALAAMQGARLVEMVTDKETGKEGSIRHRPGILRILELISQKQITAVYIGKLDRLTRSVVDMGELLTILDKSGCSLASASESWLDTGSPTGRLLINVICCFSQLELEMISDRTSTVLQYKKAHNQVFNHTPYGFRAVGKSIAGRRLAGMKLVKDDKEQAIIAKAKAWRQKGSTLQNIADKLNELKTPTKGRRQAGQTIRGKWYPSTVRNILA